MLERTPWDEKEAQQRVYIHEVPYTQLPEFSPYEKAQKVGIDGDINVWREDLTKVIKTVNVDTKPKYCACINRFADIKRIYPDYKDRYPNVLFPDTVYEYRGKTDGFTADPRYVDIVMERMDGDLTQVLIEGNDLSDEDIKGLLIGTTRAVDQLLTLGMTHGDLKLANFLYKKVDGKYHVYICDQGNAHVLPFRPEEFGTSTKNEFIFDARRDRARFVPMIAQSIIQGKFSLEVQALLQDYGDTNKDTLMTQKEFEDKLNQLF